MKKLLAVLLICAPLAAQTCTPSASQTCTPNVGLAMPVHNSQNWDTALNNNSTLLDNIFSGTTSIPGIKAASVNGVLVVDGVKYTTIAAAIAALPSSGGEIYIPAGTYTVSSTITITSPAVRIRGAGSQSTIINCTGTGDCFNIRVNPFTISPGFYIGGLSIVGTGSGNLNAVGIHTGDMVGGRFEDLQIDNFTGANSACFWADNQLGWFERNLIQNVELGIHGTTQSGCTKELRFTVNGGNTSFEYNDWNSIRFSPAVSGQIGISIEGTSGLAKNVIVGNANLVPGTTLIALSGSANGNGNFINLRTECTVLGGCLSNATGWSNSSASVSFVFSGPGIVTGGDTHVVDAITQPQTIISQYSNASGLTGPDFAGYEAFAVPTTTGINESIPIGPNNGAGLGSVIGTNIQHPIMWSYIQDTDCFKFYRKSFEVPLSSSAVIAQLPCGGNTSSNIVLDNLAQTLTNKSTSAGPLSGTVASGTAAMTTAAIASGACGTTVTVAATGVLTTDAIESSPNAAVTTPNGLLTLNKWPTAGNVNFAYCNPTAGSLTPGAATINWRVGR